MLFIGRFGFRCGADFEKFNNSDINYKLGIIDVPIVLDNSCGYVEAELLETLDMGTHTIFVGKVVNAEKLNNDNPMTYTYYHDVIKGKTAKKAPTYNG